MPVKRRKKLDHRAVKSRFVEYMAGSKGWKILEPVSNTFVESAHAEWLSEDLVESKENKNPTKSEPTPDPPSSIRKLLNLVSCEEDSLLEALRVTYDLADRSTTKGLREQDRLVQEIWGMAAGIGSQLPRSFNAAMKSDESELWREACEKDINMLRSMKVWEKVSLPVGKRVVSSKWVSNRKHDANGRVFKHKARFVVRGFNQREGIDFQEMLALTARFYSLMIIFAILVKKRWYLRVLMLYQCIHTALLMKRSTLSRRMDTHVLFLGECLCSSVLCTVPSKRRAAGGSTSQKYLLE